MNSGGVNFKANNIFCDVLNAGTQNISRLTTSNVDISGTLEFISQDKLDTFSMDARRYSGTNSLVTRNTTGTIISALDKNGNFAVETSLAAPLGNISLVSNCYQIDNGTGTINLGNSSTGARVYLNQAMICGNQIQLATRIHNTFIPFQSNATAANAQTITLDTGPTQFNMVALQLTVNNTPAVDYINFNVVGISAIGNQYIYDMYYYDTSTYTYTTLLVTGKMCSVSSASSMYFYFQFNNPVPYGTSLYFSLLQTKVRFF